jgi:hypothetical protein
LNDATVVDNYTNSGIRLRYSLNDSAGKEFPNNSNSVETINQPSEIVEQNHLELAVLESEQVDDESTHEVSLSETELNNQVDTVANNVSAIYKDQQYNNTQITKVDDNQLENEDSSVDTNITNNFKIVTLIDLRYLGRLHDHRARISSPTSHLFGQ